MGGEGGEHIVLSGSRCPLEPNTRGSGYSLSGGVVLASIFEVTITTIHHDSHKTLCPYCWIKKKKTPRFIRELINKPKKILVCLLIIEE
jgi:hypothetical protein